MNVQDYLYRAADRYPGKEAVVQTNKRMTYGEVLHSAAGLAGWLIDEQVNPGDRVAILTDDPSDYIVSYFGILIAGGTVVALNTQTTARDIRYVCNHSGASFIITHLKFSRHIAEAAQKLESVQSIALRNSNKDAAQRIPVRCVDFAEIVESMQQGLNREKQISVTRNKEDMAQIIYTSGTTGRPKGVMLSHANLMANTDSIMKYLKIGPEERHMVVLPFFYSFGNSVLLTHFAAGATLVVNQSFMYPKVVLDMMQQEKVTGLSGVPSTYAILLNRSPLRKYQFPDLRYLAQAGGPMPHACALELKKILPSVDIYIMYGQTEASARLSYLPPEYLIRKTGSIGKAIPGVTLAVLNKEAHPVHPGETGEIVARGDNIMTGYWRDPDETAKVIKNGFLWTGDLAKTDEEGFLYIVSRKSDMIKSGAHRIGPREIEEVILEQGHAHEAAAFGIPDDILGEEIAVAIVLKTDTAVTDKDILAHCKKNLPAYKIPHRVFFMNELPKTASGKVKKNELKEKILN